MIKQEEILMGVLTVNDEKNIFSDNHKTFEEREKELTKQQEYENEMREREKNSPFKNWYQFNTEHSDKMVSLALNFPKAHAILLFLLHEMDNYNAVMCSYKVFEEALGIAQATIARSIKTLKDKGFVYIMKSGSGNVYIINDNLAWKSWGTNRKYCKFPANVILSASENEEYFSNLDKAKLKQVYIKGGEDSEEGYNTKSPTEQSSDVSAE